MSAGKKRTSWALGLCLCQGHPSSLQCVLTTSPQVLHQDLRDKPPTSPMLFGKAGRDDIVCVVGRNLSAPEALGPEPRPYRRPQPQIVSLKETGGVGWGWRSEGELGTYLGIAKGWS